MNIVVELESALFFYNIVVKCECVIFLHFVFNNIVGNTFISTSFSPPYFLARHSARYSRRDLGLNGDRVARCLERLVPKAKPHVPSPISCRRPQNCGFRGIRFLEDSLFSSKNPDAPNLAISCARRSSPSLRMCAPCSRAPRLEIISPFMTAWQFRPRHSDGSWEGQGESVIIRG